MKAMKTKVGKTNVLVEMMEGDVDIRSAKSKKKRKTRKTGVKDDLVDAYQAAKDVINEIATDLGTQVGNMAESTAPTDVELEFALGFSAEAGLWIVTGKGEASLKVKLAWSPKKND